MYETWNIESHNILDSYDSKQSGENLNYKKNIEQKLNNTITLPFVFNNKKNTYSNFSYNKDGSKLAIIIKNEERTNFELILYIPSKYEVKYDQNLNNIISKQNYNKFLIHDERNIIYKLFGNLSFLRLSQDTNNIYFLTENQLLLTSLDRTIFVFIKLNEQNEYYYENESENNKDNKNSGNTNNDINDCVIVKNLEDIIHEIKKNYIDMNLKLSFISKNIDNLINNSIPKNIYMDLPSYLFSKNYYFLIDHNKIILIFYIENNTDNKQYILIFFLNYKYTNNINEPLSLEEDQKMTLEFCIGDTIKENNILSIISKIKNGYLVIALSFKDEHFQIILIDMQLRLFKKYISKIFFVPTKRKGNITVITDLFIYDKYAFIIFDFYYIIIFDLIIFDIISIDDKSNDKKDTKNNIPNYINIKKLFRKSYNKTIYLDFEKLSNNRKSKNINDRAYLYLVTKKDNKFIEFNILKNDNRYKNSKNILTIIKMINKKQNKDINSIISNFNNNELYFYLSFLATLQKFSKNNNFNEKYFSQILHIINNKILKNIYLNLKSKNGCIMNILLLNQNKYFGIYNSFLRYNISTIKYLYFIENIDLNDNDNSHNNETINYLKIHKLFKNNENSKNICLNDYFLSLSNNYLLIYQLISIIALLLIYDQKINKNLIKLYIYSNFEINDNNGVKFILNKIKQILYKLNKNKILNPFNSDKKISYYNIKKKIIMEIRNNLMNISSNNNLSLFESTLVLIRVNFYNEKNIKEYSYKEIKFIKFIYFLISYYLNKIINSITLNNKQIINLNIYNLYNINDILYSLDYLNIPFEDIIKKFFIKEILIKIDNIVQIKELFYILLSLKLINGNNKDKNKILNYFDEYNNIEKNNYIIDPILFLLYLQNDKDYKNVIQENKNNINILIQELIEKKN